MPFEPFTPVTDWNDFYQRPYGKEPCFHVTVNNQVRILQSNAFNLNFYTADMNTAGMRELALSVNRCKSLYAGQTGGSFSVNEYGIVIVPINNSSVIKAVGRWTGKMYFYDGTTHFSLDEAFQLGAAWPYPYLGMKYHLAQRNYIYRAIVTAGGTIYDRLPFQYNSLVNALRTIRPSGPMTFVVNPSGAVLAKQNFGGVFLPCYIGKLDLTQWFPGPLTGSAQNSPANMDISQVIIDLKKKRMCLADAKRRDNLIHLFWQQGRQLSPQQKQDLWSLKNKYP